MKNSNAFKTVQNRYFGIMVVEYTTIANKYEVRFCLRRLNNGRI